MSKGNDSMKTLQEVAGLVCDMHTQMTIRPVATGHGIKWDCEIVVYNGHEQQSVVLVEEAGTPDFAANMALEAFRRTEGSHAQQVTPRAGKEPHPVVSLKRATI